MFGVLLNALEGAIRGEAAAVEAAIRAVQRNAERSGAGGANSHVAVCFEAVAATPLWDDLVRLGLERCRLLQLGDAALAGGGVEKASAMDVEGEGEEVAGPPSHRSSAGLRAYAADITTRLTGGGGGGGVVAAPSATEVTTTGVAAAASAATPTDSSMDTAAAKPAAAAAAASDVNAAAPQLAALRLVAEDRAAVTAIRAAVDLLEGVGLQFRRDGGQAASGLRIQCVAALRSIQAAEAAMLAHNIDADLEKSAAKRLATRIALADVVDALGPRLRRVELLHVTGGGGGDDGVWGGLASAAAPTPTTTSTGTDQCSAEEQPDDDAADE